MLDNLILSLNTVTPVLVLTLLGMLMKKIKLLPDSFYSGADKFVFDLALPALIFVQIVSADMSGGGNFMRLPLFTSIMLVCTCTLFSVITHLTVKNPARVGASVQGMFRSNSSILGVVFITNIYAGTAESPAALAGYAITMPFVILMYNVLSVIVLTIFMPTEEGEGKRKINIGKILLNTIKNPLIIAVLLGLPFMLFGWKLPAIVDRSVGYLADSATALALISLGAGFSFETLKGNITLATVTSVVKTVIHPILGVAAAYLLGFRGNELLITFIVFGTPSAVSSYIMAKNMKSDYELAGQILLLSTLFCIFTIFLGVFLMKTVGWI
ncbi:MAG: AEC family transporter [Clostridia bacterium]|nr:AEC family transporter [Clostridia bacterium]